MHNLLVRSRLFPALFASVILACSSSIFAAKAYELVKYRGKAGTLKIAFDFGAGYPEASEVRITDTKTGKTRRFMLEEDGADLSFIPDAKTGGEGKIVLKMSSSSEPDKVNGTYTSGGKTIDFVLKRQ